MHPYREPERGIEKKEGTENRENEFVRKKMHYNML